jgi:hypothetical protein
MSVNANEATVQVNGQLLGQERKVGVVYWEWYDEGSQRVGAAEVSGTGSGSTSSCRGLSG